MRGQVTLEALLVAGMAIVVVLSLVNVVSERIDFARDVGEGGEIRLVGELLATAINNVYANSEGFRIYLGAGDLNYTYLGSNVGGSPGLVLPIRINTSGRAIVLRKNMSETGLGTWDTSIPIIPSNISVNNDLTTYNETTILNNGASVIIYASSDHMEVIS